MNAQTQLDSTGGQATSGTHGTHGTMAVVCDRHGNDATAVAAFLQARDAATARWYAPRELDEVDKAVRAGRVRQVVFARLDDVLEGMWDEDISLEHWLAAGVRIELVESPEPAAHTHVQVVFESWQRWRHRHRRRRLVAGVVLSIVAMAAAFVLLYLST